MATFQKRFQLSLVFVWELMCFVYHSGGAHHPNAATYRSEGSGAVVTNHRAHLDGQLPGQDTAHHRQQILHHQVTPTIQSLGLHGLSVCAE